MKIASVYYELTNICNLNCQTCFNRSGLNRKRDELPIDTLIQSMQQFRSLGARSFMFGGGEPLLYTDIDKLITYFSDNPDLIFTFTTNGTVHLPSLIEYYKANPNLFVQVSLDGSCEDINAPTRGTGNFKLAMDFVKALGKRSVNPYIKLKMVISKYNLSDIPFYYQLASENGCIPEFAFIEIYT